jgi:probable rRNA maturation factor
MKKKSERRTSNVQRPTSKDKTSFILPFDVGRWTLDVGRLHFRLTFHAPLGAQFIPYLRKNLRKARAILGSPLSELSIALVNDKRMSALHERFLGLRGATDVLTFPMDLNVGGRAVSGEVVICVPHARRAAKKHGVSVRNELLLYALHGMLHLMGFDDRTAAQYKHMHCIEDEILAQLGVGPVFEPSAGSRRARGER